MTSTKQPKKRPIKEPETMQEVLAIIRKFFNNKPSHEALKLWSVLTALRGPDMETVHVLTSENIKYMTTALLRYLVLGTGPAVYCAALVNRTDRPEKIPYTKKEFCSIVGIHFYSHITTAFYAIGLPLEFKEEEKEEQQKG